MDLPVWQSLFDEMKDQGFIVITVAMDQPPAARAWIEAAQPTHPSLIDQDHHVADLYNMINVPQATWIDETGRIVRPPENAGSSDAFRRMNRETGEMPPDALAERVGMKRTYLAAVRDWVANGSASEHVFEPAGAKAHLQLPDADTVAAHAHFRLAQHLLRSGNGDEAAQHFAEASRLHPEFLEHLAAGGEERAERVRSRSRLLGKS